MNPQHELDEIIKRLEECIDRLKAVPDAGNSVHLRWTIYKLLQAQQSDGDCAIYKELRCSIHLGLAGENGPPVTLPCGHTYCRSCIAQVIHENQNCPDCRGVIPPVHLHNNVAIKAIVDRLIPRSAPRI
jgi:hypothetical protein